MKFTLSWLKDHLDTTASLEEITSKLTMIGLEVEDVYNPAEALSIFRVAKILEAEKHPDADKLKLCKVEAQIDGELKVLQVVCGAPNARTGLLGVFAPPGATIPSNGMVLKPTKIRGIESNGMMCSESELELSEDHDGIIEIAEGVAVGTPAVDALNLNDPVIEIAITPNRPDCLGVYGVARDLAAAGLGTLKTPSQPSIQEGFESSIKIELDFSGEETVICPHFSGRLIKGVKNGTSPAWMQSRLRAIGLRPINTLVDITNYVTFDRGRPLHVYDAAKLSGNIVARMGKGETFEALDGKEYKAENGMCVIADSANVLGFGGIMGGQASGSTEETTDVFVESAYFDPYKTAATGRKTGINSDARFRFERGIDPASVEDGCDIGTALILELCGGQASTREVAGELAWQPLTISFDPQRVTRLTGVALGNSEITTILTNLGFGVTPEGERLSVAVPSWRPDVLAKPILLKKSCVFTACMKLSQHRSRKIMRWLTLC
jgi:phenylalanyl-tRNA synthetase beta chain